MAEDIADKLGGKLGKFPVWVWGAGAAGLALVGYYVFYRRGTSTAAAGSTGSTIDGTVGYSTNNMSGPSSSGTVVDAAQTADTQTAWLARVSRQVGDKLSASPSTVYAALYKYVTGQDITATEKKYVDSAIGIGGTPPEGVQGIGNVIDDAYKFVTSLGLFKAQNSPEVYELRSDGTKQHVTAAEFRKGDGTFTITSDAELAKYKDSGRTIKGYIRDATSGNIYESYSDGTKRYLDRPTWDSLSGAKYTDTDPYTLAQIKTVI